MKTNIVARIIIDDENNKAYLSVEGDVKNATNEERIQVRENLVQAFSKILGIEDASEVKSSSDLGNDFIESQEDVVPDFLKETENEGEIGQNQEDTKDQPLNDKDNVKAEPDAKVESVPKKTEVELYGEELAMGFGQYRRSKPSEIIEKGKSGINHLLWMVDKKVLEDRRSKNQETEESYKNKSYYVAKALDSIDPFKKNVDELMKYIVNDDFMKQADDMLRASSNGMTVKQAIDKKHMESIDYLLRNFVPIVKKAERESKRK